MFFGERASLIKNLFVQSFKLLGEENVKKLLFDRVRFSVFWHVVAILVIPLASFDLYERSISTPAYAHNGLISAPVLIGLLFVVYMYSFLYHLRMRAKQTWFAYAKITNHNAPMEESKKMVAGKKWDLLLFAIIEFFLASATNNNSEQQGKGILSFFVSIVLALLSGIYEVAEGYLLPTIIIEQTSISEAAKKLRQLSQNVPEVLAGSFGLDIFGGVVSSLLGIIYLGIFLAGVALAFYLPNSSLIPHRYIIEMHNDTGGNINIFIYPIVCALILCSLLRHIIKIIVSSLQAIYFTVFYTRINHPDEIMPEIRKQIDVFLQQPGSDMKPTKA